MCEDLFPRECACVCREGPLLPALAQEGEACEAPIPSPSTAASNTVIDDEPCLKRHKAEEVNGCGGLSDSAAAPELPTVAVEPQPPPPDPGVVIGALPSESASDGPTVPSAPVQRVSEQVPALVPPRALTCLPSRLIVACASQFDDIIM